KRLVPHRALPPYAYIPGRTPHPVSDPLGHQYGVLPVRIKSSPGSTAWAEEFLFGVDLWQQGFYWEAHETWEGLWHAVGRTGSWGDLLKGLIKLAAAGVKAREGRREGVGRHATRAAQLIRVAKSRWDPTDLPLPTWNWPDLLTNIESVAANPVTDVTPDPGGYPVWDWLILASDDQPTPMDSADTPVS
ncbi:MAG: hypothetical protein B7Z55_19945, partial [Planctomycetales bacterium 12-60-4]